MKARGFIAALGLGVLIGVIVFCETSAATPPAENAQWTPPQQRLPVNQPSKTKSKQAANANVVLKGKQSNNSQALESSGPRKDANSRPQVESHGREHYQEKGDLIVTGVGVVLSAIRKPAPTPTPQPALVVIRATPTEQKVRRTDARIPSPATTACGRRLTQSVKTYRAQIQRQSDLFPIRKIQNRYPRQRS